MCSSDLQTKAYVEIAKVLNFTPFIDKLVEISNNGKKYEKWLVVNTNTDDLDKAIISGHYYFSQPSFIEALSDLENLANRKSFDFQNFVRQKVRNSIERYLVHFGY